MVAKVGATGSITVVEEQPKRNGHDTVLLKLLQTCQQPGFRINEIMHLLLEEQALILQEMTEYATDDRMAFQFKSCESRLRVITNLWRAIERARRA